MSQSPARRARRACKRYGHLAKTHNGSSFWCANCGVALNQDGSVAAGSSGGGQGSEEQGGG